ncbi:hypothetical protein PG995_000258 [Apiospora arundinis]
MRSDVVANDIETAIPCGELACETADEFEGKNMDGLPSEGGSGRPPEIFDPEVVQDRRYLGPYESYNEAEIDWEKELRYTLESQAPSTRLSGGRRVGRLGTRREPHVRTYRDVSCRPRPPSNQASNKESISQSSYGELRAWSLPVKYSNCSSFSQQ